MVFHLFPSVVAVCNTRRGLFDARLLIPLSEHDQWLQRDASQGVIKCDFSLVITLIFAACYNYQPFPLSQSLGQVSLPSFLRQPGIGNIVFASTILFLIFLFPPVPVFLADFYVSSGEINGEKSNSRTSMTPSLLEGLWANATLMIILLKTDCLQREREREDRTGESGKESRSTWDSGK